MGLFPMLPHESHDFHDPQNIGNYSQKARRLPSWTLPGRVNFHQECTAEAKKAQWDRDITDPSAESVPLNVIIKMKVKLL